MSAINKIQLPNGVTYDLEDSKAFQIKGSLTQNINGLNDDTLPYGIFTYGTSAVGIPTANVGGIVLNLAGSVYNFQLAYQNSENQNTALYTRTRNKTSIDGWPDWKKIMTNQGGTFEGSLFFSRGGESYSQNIFFGTTAANGTDFITVDQQNWGLIAYQVPAKRKSDNTYLNAHFFLRQYSPTNNGIRTDYYEDYWLPATDKNLAENKTYYILTTKNPPETSFAGSLRIKNTTSQTHIDRFLYFAGVNNSYTSGERTYTSYQGDWITLISRVRSKYVENNTTTWINPRFFIRYKSANTNLGTETGYYEEYLLPIGTENLQANVSYNILTTKNAVAITQGGTGATTTASAKVNLDICSAGQDAKISSTESVNQAFVLSAIVTNSNYTDRLNHRLGIIPRENGISLYDYTNSASVWSLGLPVSVSNGGTGASTATEARTNLGITPANIGALALGGGTMTGDINMGQSTASSSAHIIIWTTADGTIFYLRPYANLFQLTRKAPGQNTVNVLGVRSDGTYLIENPIAFRNALSASSGVWPVNLGGTGGTTAKAARISFDTPYTVYTDTNTWSALFEELDKIALGGSGIFLLSADSAYVLSNKKINAMLMATIFKAGSTDSYNFRIIASSDTGANLYSWKITGASSSTRTTGTVYRYSGTSI